MVTTTPTRVPLTKPLRDHIRTDATTLMALLSGDGVYAADNLPKSADLPAVCIRKTAAGGLFEQLDQVLYRFDIWATSLATCEEVEAELRTFLEAVRGAELPVTGSPTHAPVVLGIDAPPATPAPDPDDGTPRLVLTATVTAKAVAYTP